VSARRRNSTDRTGRSKKEARHVRLYYWMMQTAAWESLSGDQRAIYVEMAVRYNGSNNGRIHFSIREAAAAVHVSKDTAARALAALVERGFIVAMIRGGFNVKDKQAQATEWRLTAFNCDITHALPSKDFTRWSPQNISRSHHEDANVLLVRPKRPSGETETRKNGPERPSGETFKLISGVPRSHHKDTYKLPGGGSSVSASPAADPTSDLSIPDFLRQEEHRRDPVTRDPKAVRQRQRMQRAQRGRIAKRNAAVRKRSRNDDRDGFTSGGKTND
jgi:hypothetical protein